jgi:hypothetical protein
MRALLTVFVLMLSTAVASAQNIRESRERLIVSGNAGNFRISFDGFKELYGARNGLTVGAAAIVKIYTPYYAIVKYRQFDKDNEVLQGGISRQQKWEERWYNIGVRYLSYGERKVTSFFGFGFSFFNINESGPLSVFGISREPGKRDASGFFLDGGLEYRFSRYASFYFEIEVTSAGIEGKSGFEGSSVGGFLIGGGINVFVL